jgi:hypothetical protein
MATPWPQQPAWLTPFHEHATRLIIYLQGALTCIDRSNSQPVPAGLAKNIIHGTLTFILKVQHAPDLNTVCDALRILQIETKTSSKHTTQSLTAVKDELKNTTEAIRGIATNIQQNVKAWEYARQQPRKR